MKAIGIILAGGNNNRMKELTAKRAVPALPVAGSFRAIDFSLSSMSNSHIQTVAILTQYNARSLNEHLSSSKWWNFGRKQGDYSSLHLQSQRTTVTGTGVRQMRCIRILIFSKDAMSHMSSSAAVTVYTSWISTECLIFTLRKNQTLQWYART